MYIVLFAPGKRPYAHVDYLETFTKLEKARQFIKEDIKFMRGIYPKDKWPASAYLIAKVTKYG